METVPILIILTISLVIVCICSLLEINYLHKVIKERENKIKEIKKDLHNHKVIVDRNIRDLTIAAKNYLDQINRFSKETK